jgi:hypothetical protein
MGPLTWCSEWDTSSLLTAALGRGRSQFRTLYRIKRASKCPLALLRSPPRGPSSSLFKSFNQPNGAVADSYPVTSATLLSVTSRITCLSIADVRRSSLNSSSSTPPNIYTSLECAISQSRRQYQYTTDEYTNNRNRG